MRMDGMKVSSSVCNKSASKDEEKKNLTRGGRGERLIGVMVGARKRDSESGGDSNSHGHDDASK